MHKGFFYHSGKYIYRGRYVIVLIWTLVLLASIPFASRLLLPFTSIGFTDPQSKSALAEKLLNDKIGYSYNQFIVMYQSKHLLITSDALQDEIKKSLEHLKNIAIKHEIIYPDANNKEQISKDKHTGYAVILFKSKQEADPKVLKLIQSEIRKPAHLSIKIGGESVFLDDTKTQTQRDLYGAEYFATPVAIITMLLVFGTVVAASIPILLGGVGAFLILVALCCLGHLFDLSVFTINIALLLGLCLSLDYALFIISRFREEFAKTLDVEEAIAITQATAGKAVFFSGLAVFVSLSALLLFPINVLFSVGMGGLAAVTVSVVIATTLLPAILGILKQRINYLSLPFLNPEQNDKRHFWLRVVTNVLQHRYFAFFSLLAILLFLGSPFLHVEFGISDFRILPKSMQSREVFDIFKNKFGERRLSPILVLVKVPHGSILSTNHLSHLYRLVTEIKDDARVDQVTGIVSTDPRLTEAQYQALYSHPEQLPEAVKKLLRITTNHDLTVLTVVSKYPGDSVETKQLIAKLRHLHPGHGMTVAITGGSVNTIDVLNSISHHFIYALLWICILSYLILLILLRSLILPLKAVIMTMLSLFASYGVLTFIIQYGHLHQLLRFEPQGMLDISLLIIIFCALFGISMDYEVFLLSRIKEYYEQTHDTTRSILAGIDHSSRIITSAALIVIFLCFSFMSADILIVKAFGLGIAVAAFVDAFLIRTIFVPATMAILGKWNWYLPKWIGAMLPRVE